MPEAGASRRLRLLTVGSLALTGCLLAPPEPIPLNGPMPRTVMVLPVRPAEPPGNVAGALLATIGDALRRRGYEVIPVDRGLARLGELGLSRDRSYPVEDYAAAARALGADAFLSVRVERWSARYAPTLVYLGHDLGYRLWDADSGALLWEMRSHGDWTWDGDEVYYDPSSGLDAYLTPTVKARAFSPYKDDAEAARMIHRFAMLRLPVCTAR